MTTTVAGIATTITNSESLVGERSVLRGAPICSGRFFFCALLIVLIDG